MTRGFFDQQEKFIDDILHKEKFISPNRYFKFKENLIISNDQQLNFRDGFQLKKDDLQISASWQQRTNII